MAATAPAGAPHPAGDPAGAAAGEIAAGDHVDGRVTARVVLLCALAILAEGYDVGIMGASLIALRAEPGWTADPLLLGLLSSASLAGMLVGAALIGSWAGRAGLRRPLAGCVAGFSLAAIGCALAPSPAWFALCRWLGGIAMGGSVPLAAAYTIEYSPARTRLRNYGLMYSGYSLGIMAVALLAVAVVPALGWRGLFWIGGLPLLFVPVLLAALPESLHFLASAGRIAPAAALAARLGLDPALLPALASGMPGAAARPAPGTALRLLFAPAYRRATICFWLALALGLMLAYAAGTWLPAIMRARGFALGSSLGFLATFSLCSAAGGIVAGLLADRLGARPVIMAAFAAGAAAFFGLSRVATPSAAFALAGLAGFGSVSAALTLTGHATAWYPPALRATAIGWALGFARLGAIAGPIVTGAILAASRDDPGRGLAILAALALAPALLVALVGPRRRAAA